MNIKYPNYYRRTPSRKEESRKMAEAAEQICLKLTIAILVDVFGFGDKRIHRFTDAYVKLADSLGVGKDTIEKIEYEIKKRFNV